VAEFWKRVSDFALVDNKVHWNALWVIAHTVSSKDNCFGYSLWATSQYSFGQVSYLLCYLLPTYLLSYSVT
jgi:hypothetical protein